MCSRKDYSYVISGYRNELRVNKKTSLSAYCRSIGLSISAVHHWMEDQSLSVKKIKDEVSVESPFSPLSAEMPVSGSGVRRLEMLFPNGVRLSAEDYQAGDLLTLLNGYHGGRE